MSCNVVNFNLTLVSFSLCDEIEENEEIQTLLLCGFAVKGLLLTHKLKYVCRRLRSSLRTGSMLINEILNDHESRCYELFRLHVSVFNMLCRDLVAHYGLKKSCRVSIVESLAWMWKSVSARVFFNHSGETIHRHFHKALDVVVNLSKDIIKPNANYNKTIPGHILNNPRYYPYFNKTIGKFYLVDAGYPNKKGYLSPYKGSNISYHIPDFRRGQTRVLWEPKGFKEKFNYYNSSLFNVIERTFGVWKARWVLLRDMHVNFNFETQVKIVLASMAIHNYIRMSSSGDAAFQIAKEESCIPHNDEGPADGIEPHDELSCRQHRSDDMYMSAVRDMIAGQIFSRSNTRACNDKQNVLF
uniref:DUF8040 domain-containing protein n=1 Tax=Lactuca sativa TaxID=4236 RepID=A0A9R1WZ49_LACSA|nr:hypothetical protein LSAT_V11C800389510 [Lactuca sativa]